MMAAAMEMEDASMGHAPTLQAELPVTELDRWLNEVMA
jgi:hypothetical protein